MSVWLWILFSFLIVQRLAELIVAKRNEHWMKTNGAFEAGQDHYKWFVIMHTVFFISILIESSFTTSLLQWAEPYLFLIFIFAQIFRIWCIVSLGRFWNTKIIILPGADLVRKGPYRFLNHPNYLIVGIELFIIPLLFHAYASAIVFPLLHLLLLLRYRLPSENQALKQLKS